MTRIDDELGRRLSTALQSHRVFAVVDAAHFEFMQDTLTLELFDYDALYLDEVDNPTIASGPHLVYVSGEDQITRLREIVGDVPACVWWIWPNQPDAESAIYRHLRGINMVEIPKDRPERSIPTSESGYEAVLFRHGDPNVLAATVPTMDRRQLERFLGNTVSVIIDPPNYPGLRIFKIRGEGERGPILRGMLRIGGETQYDAITSNRIENSQDRIAAFLRNHPPTHREPLSDTEIWDLIDASEETGRAFGIKTERGLARWAYMMMVTEGRVAELPETAEFLRMGGNPDQRVKEMLAQTAHAMETGAVAEPSS